MWERWIRRGLLALSVVLAGFLGYLLRYTIQSWFFVAIGRRSGCRICRRAYSRLHLHAD